MLVCVVVRGGGARVAARVVVPMAIRHGPALFLWLHAPWGTQGHLRGVVREAICTTPVTGVAVVSGAGEVSERCQRVVHGGIAHMLAVSFKEHTLRGHNATHGKAEPHRAHGLFCAAAIGPGNA